jgi:NADH:ubiquinone oxidoreductase subunit 2 (subunit N)
MYLPYRWLLGAALLIKLGAAPFHFWFPSVSSGIG